MPDLLTPRSQLQREINNLAACLTFAGFQVSIAAVLDAIVEFNPDWVRAALNQMSELEFRLIVEQTVAAWRRNA